MSILHGIVCANITPFDEKKNVDYESVRTLARYLADSGIQAVYPLGTNGEGMALSTEERKKVTEIMKEEIAGKIIFVPQCGAATLDQTMELVLHAKEIGADAAGVVTPFFFHLSDNALYDYYSAILEAAGDFPVYIYNIPTNSNNDIPVSVVKQLAEKYSNLAGVKYSYPDIMRICAYVDTKQGGLDTLIGCDRLIYPAYKGGAVGTVTGPAAVFPEIFNKMWSAAISGKDEEAIDLQYQLKHVSERMAKFQEIPMIKQYLKSIGVIKNDVCRIPFYSVSAEEQKEIAQIIQDIKENFSQENRI